MGRSLTIIDADYKNWVKELSQRYRRSQIKAAVKVNNEVLKFYWELGRDIVGMDADNKYGSGFYKCLSNDLKEELPGVDGLSPSNLRYTKRFYLLYNELVGNFQQIAENSDDTNLQQLAENLFSVPWGHHLFLIDKCSNDAIKAYYYVRQTVENAWSRAMLENFYDTNLFEREGKALTNFKYTLPAVTSDLAQEMTRDPYNFGFAKLTKKHNETQFKDALLNNISKFLLELGTGFAYVGKEYRLQIGKKEKFIDLLFYNLNLRCYVVIEVKMGEFDSGDIGQIGTYVTAVNHILCKEGIDNPTIGLLICKSKDSLLAQYALESSSQPIGISEFELSKLYPEKVEGTIPTCEELEHQLMKDKE